MTGMWNSSLDNEKKQKKDAEVAGFCCNAI